MTVEQMVRELLKEAIADGLVIETVNPDTLSVGELIRPANLLNEYLGAAARNGGPLR